MFKQLYILFFLIFTGCGTIIGNGLPSSNQPTNAPTEEQLDMPITLYNENSLNDCGHFSELSTPEDIQEGRNCIKNADINCIPSKYLFHRTNDDETRFVSLVQVVSDEDQCSIKVYTVSNEPGNFLNDERTCDEFTQGTIPELSCGFNQ
ncbi:MAG: hypothetical protein KDD46_01020 [Bdellovibrionales bacterium]|nr:hypothetical protein [Bdellovibrionales bacterium]